MTDLRETKIFVGGIQGSGKTYLTSSQIIPAFDNIVIYAVHPTDFMTMKLDENTKAKIIIPHNYLMEELERTAKSVKKMALNGECDLFVIDEADMFLPNDKRTLQKKFPAMYDLIINHRHYKKGYPKTDDKNLKGLAILFITRRPQSIPTEVVEQCEHLFLFAIEGDNVKDKMESIDGRYKPLIPQLSKEKHNFIYKRIGEAPKLYSGAKVNRESESNERRLN